MTSRFGLCASRIVSRGLSTQARVPTASRAVVLPLGSAPRSSFKFSTSTRRLGEGSSDGALSTKLEEELKWEKENNSGAIEPEWLTDFKREGIWTIEDRPGWDEVRLTRTFGSEQCVFQTRCQKQELTICRIQVLFSLADLDAPSPQPQQPVAEQEEGEMLEEEDSEPEFPVRAAITISKGPGQGALTVDAVAEDGLFVIDAVSFYKNDKEALDMSAEGDWKRRALYMGPEVSSLTNADGCSYADSSPTVRSTGRRASRTV